MSNQTVDLHMHSTCSDGSLSPSELVRRAVNCGVRSMALTDHDTIDGLAEAAEEARKLEVAFYSGVELSCSWQGMNIHVLCYGFEIESAEMMALCEAQKARRIERAGMIADRLEKKFNLPDLLIQAKNQSEFGVPGRPHFASAMVELGYVESHAEAFRKYLGSGKPGDVKAVWPTLEELMESLAGRPWFASLAHPRKYKMTVSKLKRFLDDFVALGGQAMEVSTSAQKQGEIGLLTDICRQYGLLASEGSDFHMPGYPWCELGKHTGLPQNLTPLIQRLLPAA